MLDLLVSLLLLFGDAAWYGAAAYCENLSEGWVIALSAALTYLALVLLAVGAVLVALAVPLL